MVAEGCLWNTIFWSLIDDAELEQDVAVKDLSKASYLESSTSADSSGDALAGRKSKKFAIPLLMFSVV